MFNENDLVIELDKNSVSRFYRRVDVWIIMYYKNNDKSRKLSETWKKLSTKMDGIVKVSAVNCEENKEICDEELSGNARFPVILAFPAN